MGSGKLGDSGMIAITAKIMMAVVVFLFFAVVLVFFLHIYAKFFTREDANPNDGTRRRRRRRFDFAGGYQEVNALRRGLDPSILKTIPVIPFNTKDFKDGLECSVCLTDVSDGEKARLLPKCNHGFHVDCIDMWFQSHSTCPLCRNAISTTEESSLEIEEEGSALALASVETELPIFPTNVLFWGNETQVSTLCNPCLDSTASTSNRSHGMLVIDIPREINEEEESKYVMPERLRRLMRLLSGDRRVFNPSSSRNVDIEQGSRSPS